MSSALNNDAPRDKIIGFNGESPSLIEKRKAAIERMGTKWILHPMHHVKNKQVEANSLGFKTA